MACVALQHSSAALEAPSLNQCADTADVPLREQLIGTALRCCHFLWIPSSQLDLTVFVLPAAATCRHHLLC
jgi:hypothetical protein